MTDDPDPREHVDERELADAWNPDIGTGTPETAPAELPRLTLLEREPVRLLGVVQAIVAAAVTIGALGVPIWAGLLLAVALYAIEELKASRVTPVANPKLADDIPLTPSEST